jgi:methanogen extracellular protein (TIGR04279 family)
MNTIVPGNQSKFFAAILVSRNNYENASIGIAENKSINSFDITLSLGSKSLQINGSPKISSELLMGLLPLLPANSAIGLQESTQQGVDLILLPDQSWEKGEYILTGGIYSPGKGLLGIKQREVLII